MYKYICLSLSLYYTGLRPASADSLENQLRLGGAATG